MTPIKLDLYLFILLVPPAYFVLSEHQYLRLPSQRTDRHYQAAIVVHKSTGNITYATCTCKAGKGQSCNHIAALTFCIEAHYKTIITQGQSTAPTCTSLPSTWNVPSKRNTQPKNIPVPQLHITKPSYLKSQKSSSQPLAPSSPLSTPDILNSSNFFNVTTERIMKLRQDLSEHCSDQLLFHQIWPEQS